MIARTSHSLARTTKNEPGVSSRTDLDSVAIVIVNYNSRRCLRECLRALASQTLAPCRVIIVDNASSDSSLADAVALYPHAEVVRSDRNVGFAAANNLAIRLATDCRYVALLNPDAYPEPEWLAQMLAAARREPTYGFFACQLVAADDPRRFDGTGDIYHVSGRAWRRDHGLPRNTTTAATTDTAPVLSACAAAALYRRDALMDVGGFDEDFFCYYEDVDLGFRLQLAGHAGRYVAEAVSRHAGSAVTVRRSDFCVYYGHRNLVWTYVKNMPGWLFWLYLPQHLALNILSVLWFTLRGRGRVILRAKWDALVGLPAVWRKRRSVQKTRKASLRQIHALLAHAPWRAYTGR